MRHWLLPILLWGCLTAGVAAEQLIDGSTAPQWLPRTAWTTTPATAYSVTNENGTLVFTAQGANCEMPWILDLDPLGLSGDQRYLIVHYRAQGLSTNPAVYFLHGEEGTRGGKAYAMADDLQPDAEWHILAVDLLAIDPLEVTHQLALKVFVDAGGSARLEIRQMWFANALPADVHLARTRPTARRSRAVGMGNQQARAAGRLDDDSGNGLFRHRQCQRDDIPRPRPRPGHAPVGARCLRLWTWGSRRTFPCVIKPRGRWPPPATPSGWGIKRAVRTAERSSRFPLAI